MALKRADVERRAQAEAAHLLGRQMLEASLWFIKLRWFAAAGIVIGGAALNAAGFTLSLNGLFAVAAYLLAANLAFHYQGLRLAKPGTPTDRRMAFNHLQVLVDWGAVIALIYLTGGATSPCIFFFFFHLVMAAILQPAMNIYPGATVVLALLAAMFVGEAASVLPHQELMPGLTHNIHRQPMVVGAIFAALATSAYFLVYFSTWVSELLRRQMRRLSETKLYLEDATNQMRAIYEVMRVIGVNFELEDILKKVVDQATTLSGIEAAFVLLYDPKGKAYQLAAMRGLASDTQPQSCQFLSMPPFAADLARGTTTSVDDLIALAENDENAPCMDWLVSQGKRSLLVVPLRVGASHIGVFCLTSPYLAHFAPEDSQYFQIFCDMVAIAIENARSNALLVEHDKTRTWFYQRAAHDLRAPLTAVTSMLSLILEGYVSEWEKVREIVGKANRRAGELKEMVNDLLLLAENKLEALKTELVPVDLRVSLESVVELHRAEAMKKDIKMSADLGQPGKEYLIRATRDGIERIFNNLVSNAVKYTPKGGEVRVALKENSETALCVEVADTGIGIPDSARQHLFKEFYRAPNAKALSEVGTGLGLSIAKKLVEDFSGTLAYDSRENQGTTFRATWGRAN
ncbi:MAG: GAF domain-containing protein [Myxococcales bacterium]|nr:MAG: GAF domain-containing protein [Myxococcales bacterium]